MTPVETIRCNFCDGPAHPATGCVYTPRVIACRACVVEFWRWLRGHFATRGRPGRDKRGRMQADFYAAAGRWSARSAPGADERSGSDGGR